LDNLNLLITAKQKDFVVKACRTCLAEDLLASKYFLGYFCATLGLLGTCYNEGYEKSGESFFDVTGFHKNILRTPSSRERGSDLYILYWATK
jgi:hypothetical protein